MRNIWSVWGLALLAPMSAWAQPAPGSMQDRAFRSGVVAGEALACGADRIEVFQYWRLTEASVFPAPPMTEPGSMFFLAGFMTGLQQPMAHCSIAVARLSAGPAR